eukprot:11745236-Karenia_brevis.AAC.1
MYGNRDIGGVLFDEFFGEQQSPDTGGSSSSGSPENGKGSHDKESPVEKMWRRHEEERKED